MPFSSSPIKSVNRRGVIFPILVFFFMSALDAAIVSVDATKTLQTIDGFGACSAWISGKITSNLADQFWQLDGRAIQGIRAGLLGACL